MLPIPSSIPRQRRSPLVLALALIAAGCAGSGGGCGGSCGGAFKTVDAQGRPFKFTGSKLDNVAQVRVTKSGFDYLNATHLNEILSSLSGSVRIPCVGPSQVFKCTAGVQVSVVAGDTNFNGTCDPDEATPLSITFKDVSWILDPASKTLRAHLVTHIKTGDIYVRTVEAHSCICGGTVFCSSHEYSPIQARIYYDDEQAGLAPQFKDTALELAIKFSTAPDGRLEFNFDDATLSTLVANFHAEALWGPDGFTGTNPPVPGSGTYRQDGCDAPTAPVSYPVSNGSGGLTCGALFRDITAGCTPDNSSTQGVLCTVFLQARGYVFEALKNSLKDQLTKILRSQLDSRRCQQSVDSQGKTVACNDTNHLCPADDNGAPLACDLSRGVCVAGNQSPQNPPDHNCEPIALGIAGELDMSESTQKVGFPPNTKLDLFAGLGSKTASPQIDANGLQLSGMAGTAPASNFVGLCVPPVVPSEFAQPPALNFDDANNKPAGVTSYDLGFALASAMVNRGFADAYNAGMLCVAITNKTTSFISSGLVKAFLPSLGLITGGKDVPMIIQLRPTQPPFVRIGRNTVKQNPDGTTSPDDPLLTLNFRKLDLDFYALIEERQVRIFTLEADIQLPLGLRQGLPPNTNTLTPVLGSLDTLLTNIAVFSPDGGAYGPHDMLAEDPSVVKDLLGAAVRLAQPLLAGVLKPIALPSMLGLNLSVAGLAGAVPLQDVAAQGYAHLAVWAKVNDCAGTCEQVSVKASARIANSTMPDDAEEIRAGQLPMVEIVPSAVVAHAGARADYSYRIDGSLWSPWIGTSRLVLRDPIFLVQGHHLIEVTARETGDDATADPQPVQLDFFVSYEPPKVELYQRADGALVTRAHSPASKDAALRYSYRIDGDSLWTAPGAARIFTAADLGGHGLSVSVSDEAGRAAVAHYGELEAAGDVLKSAQMGCSTSSSTAALSLLPLLAAALFLRRQRKGSSSRG